MSRVHWITALSAAFFALHPSTSFADEGPANAPEPADKRAFGDAGQLALSVNQGFEVNSTDILDGSGLQANVFVVKHLSLGLATSVQWSTSSSSATSSAGFNEFALHVGPRIGYDIPFSDAVSFWPQLGIDYRMLRSSPVSVESPTGTPMGTTTLTESALGLTVVAPIVVHPTRGFFVGAGPTFYTELLNKSAADSGSGDNPKVTAIGLMAMIGGAI